MVRVALLIALIAGVANPASACPPGPCNKYRHMVPDRTVQALAVGYTRRITVRMPRLSRDRVAAVLTGSIWDPVYAPAGPNVRTIPPPSIRFAFARNVRRPARDNIRTVLIRRIEFRNREALIEVDGQVFVLERCDQGMPDACLNLRADASFDDDDEPIADTQFAKPPR
jgi:hypothetical protein